MKRTKLKFFCFLLLLLAPLTTPLSATDRIAQEWSNTFKQHKNKVVQIFVNDKNYNVQYFKPHTTDGECGACTGSGFFISADGDIITCFHVIEDCEDKIFIKLPQLGKEQFEVTFQGGYPDLDCALLRLKDEERKRILTKLNLAQLPFFSLGNSDMIEEGQEIMAIGYPFSENVKSATGIISGPMSQESGEWKATTVPLNPGNSGGPLVDKTGAVMGIAEATRSGETGETYQTYMIPSTNIKNYLPLLKNQAIVRVPFWGIHCNELSQTTLDYLKAPATGGAFVSKVLAASLGEKAGLHIGDIITQINGMPVDRFCRITVTWSDYQMSINDVLMRYAPGQMVTLTVFREGTTLELPIVVDSEQPFKIAMKFNPFEKIPPYEIIGGMVVMEATLNHLFAVLPIFKYMVGRGHLPDTLQYLSTEKRYESRLLITYLFPGTEIEQTKVNETPGNNIISNINGHDIKSLQDFKRAILDHADQEYIVIKTEGGAVFAFRIDDILELEPELAKQKNYKSTSLYYELLEKRKSLKLGAS